MQDATKTEGPVILLTRPEPANARFAEDLRRFTDARILSAPVTRIVPVGDPVDTAGWTALVLTSENAVSQAVPHPGKPAYCVGQRTAVAAGEAGFDPRVADGDAEALIAKILGESPKPPLLHLRGEEAAADIAGRLTAAGIATDERIVYAQRETALPETILPALEQAPELIIPVFSSRSAARLARQLPLHPRLTLVAISAMTAKAWTAPAHRVVIAARPDAEMMCDAVVALVNRDSGC